MYTLNNAEPDGGMVIKTQEEEEVFLGYQMEKN